MQSLHPLRGSIQEYLQELSDPSRYRLTTVRCATDEIPCGHTVFIAAPW
jgi:hypothetical protein